MTSKRIYQTASSQQIIATSRLMNDYTKRDSHMLWGFHLMSMFVDGFSPIIPIDYGNHKSQQKKVAQIHHFGSKLLKSITQQQISAREDVEELFNYFVACKPQLEQNKNSFWRYRRGRLAQRDSFRPFSCRNFYIH